MQRFGGSIVRVAVLSLMAAASYRAVVVAWADLDYKQATPDAIRKAERLVPSNPLYHYMNGLVTEQNEPTSPQIEREFAAAIAANPRYSDALLAWSVERELRGDKAGAEQLLLEALRIDHLLRPAWALANYYFRQGDTDRFLGAAHESLRIIGESGLSEGRFDPTPVYRLCWKSGASYSSILQRAIPDIRAILDSYFGYLLNTRRLAAASEAAAKILPEAVPGELMYLRPYLDTLIANNQMDLAVQTWRQFFLRKMVPCAGPDPNRGILLTNGDFAGLPVDFGFDWRRIFPETVRFTQSRAEHSWRFDFDRDESEQFSLLVQTLALSPGRPYRFTARYRSDFDPEPSGLRWSIYDHMSGQPIPSQTSVITGNVKAQVMEFATPAGTDSADLHLSYQRQLGTARLHGYYELRHAQLEPR